jgi:hypothetical protein
MEGNSYDEVYTDILLFKSEQQRLTLYSGPPL